MKRYQVILSLAFLAWAGYMLAYTGDAVASTKLVIMED
jgi:hypothetical protein